VKHGDGSSASFFKKNEAKELSPCFRLFTKDIVFIKNIFRRGNMFMLDLVLTVLIVCASIVAIVISTLYFRHKEKIEEIRANARIDSSTERKEDSFVDLRDDELRPN
jgi:hypothetical protein